MSTVKTVVLSFVLLGLLSACAPPPNADTTSSSKLSRVPASQQQLPQQQSQAQQGAAAPAALAPAAAFGFQAGSIAAGQAVSCDALNPDAIKKLSSETILWLAEILPNGLTRHEHFLIARDLGYEGECGKGGHSAWMNAKPGRLESFERITLSYANQWMGSAAIPTRIVHHVDARTKGYSGVFLCGGHVCYLEGKCDNLGRRL